MRIVDALRECDPPGIGRPSDGVTLAAAMPDVPVVVAGHHDVTARDVDHAYVVGLVDEGDLLAVGRPVQSVAVTASAVRELPRLTLTVAWLQVDLVFA